MFTVEEVTTAVRQVAAHEARFAVFDGANRWNAGSPGPSWIASTGNRGTIPSRRKQEWVREEEMMLDSFNRTKRMKFSDWEFEMSNFLSAGDNEHAGDILEWIAQEQEDVAEDKFDRIASSGSCVLACFAVPMAPQKPMPLLAS